MSKVLMISHLFAPDNVIGAIRPTKLAKQFYKDGFEVDIVTASAAVNFSSLQELKGIRIFRMPQSETQDKTMPSVGKIRSNKRDNIFVRALKNTYRYWLSRPKTKAFVSYFDSLAKTGELKGETYDIVFSTFGPLSSALCGLKTKKYFPKAKWVCDFRDPMVVKELSPMVRPYFHHIQNVCCRKSDMITAVSQGYLERIVPKQYRYKAKMISNGYDPSDLQLLPQGEQPNGFSFAYTGALYEGKRDLTPLLRALKELIEQGLVAKEKVVFHYAGNDFAFLFSQASQFGLAECLVNDGHLSRRDCLALQSCSRFLVLSTWNNKGEEGVFPGKFLEYMLMGKPIVSIVGGSLPNSEVTRVMEEANLGVSYEEANAEADYQKLKEYLRRQYVLFEQGLGADFQPVQEVVQRYDYQNIAKRFEELFEAVNAG